MNKKKKIKVQLPDGTIIELVPNVKTLGDFQMLWVHYQNEKYLVNEGDEYLRGCPDVFILGRKITD